MQQSPGKCADSRQKLAAHQFIQYITSISTWSSFMFSTQNSSDHVNNQSIRIKHSNASYDNVDI